MRVQISQNELFEMVSKATMQILKEYRGEDYDFPEYENPEVMLKNIFFNADTNECGFREDELGDGRIIECELQAGRFNEEGYPEVVEFHDTLGAMIVENGEFVDNADEDITPEQIEIINQFAMDYIDSIVSF